MSGNERVDPLVVCDTVSDRVGERYVAFRIGRNQPWHSEQTVLSERLRIEEGIVDAAIQHVDATRPQGRPGIDPVSFDEEIASLYERNAHAARQEAVLEVRGVEWTRSEHGRPVFAVGCGSHRGQGLDQPQRVLLDASHVGLREYPRKDLLHHAPVLEHVRHTRRRARVVLEDQELAGRILDQVDPGDVDVDPARRANPPHLGDVGRSSEHEIGWNELLLENALLAVDV
jgi:hypothetical protein